MAVTPYLNLDLPVVTETLGPLWATELNEALEVVDAHDHTSGKGKQVPTAGLNINANLTFSGYKATDLHSALFDEQSATLTGATNANAIYSVLGNLYWTNGSGVAVQITSGGALVSSPGSVTTLGVTSVSSSITIGPADTFVVVRVDSTAAARTITLPLAVSVAEGRFYIIKDVAGTANTNAITVTYQGSDTIDGVAASYVISSSYGSAWFIGNGASNWSVA